MTAGTLTITIAANAFTEGNSETSKDIRISTSFPDTDAVSPTSLFTHGITNVYGIAFTPTRLKILGNPTNFVTNLRIYSFTHAGTAITTETQNPNGDITGVRIDFFNDTYLVDASGSNAQRLRADDLSQIRTYAKV